MDRNKKELLKSLVNSASTKIDLNKVREDWNVTNNECEWDIISDIFKENIMKLNLSKEDVIRMITEVKEESKDDN